MYTDCLAEAAYYVESDGVAAIIDPMREWEPYVEKANARGAKIKYVFETHFHADFVSGHVDLARKTGAQIVYGPTAETEFEMHQAKDGEIFELGKLQIKVLHTPGHTMESSCYLLKNEEGKDHAVFTGDTLFINDVGRPDLAVASEMTKEDLASLLYDSLHNKIMPLSDDVIVYPAHGAGSSCGKNLSENTWDSLGHQKKINYALLAPDKEAFVKQVTDNIAPPPQYFPKNAMLNKTGYGNYDDIVGKGYNSLSVDEFKNRMTPEVIVVDTRPSTEVVDGYIPGSICIGLDGFFASWVGTLISNLDQPLLFVAEAGKEEEVVQRLARVGYTNCLGYLEGGFGSWLSEGLPIDTIETVSAHEFANLRTDSTLIADVRKPGEFEAQHLVTAYNFPLDYLPDHLNDLVDDQKRYVHCKTGYRSVIAISMLKREGYKNLVNIDGGIEALEQTNLELAAPVEG